MAKGKQVVVISPTYNEKGNVEQVVDILFNEVFPEFPKDYEAKVLIVDDSSPDGTGEIVKRLMKKNRHLHLLSNPNKQGLGKAYVKGMRYALDKLKADIVYEFDAEVLVSGGLAIRELLNYPNPMQESTKFSFYLTEQAEKFSLELFTLSGKKIKSFHRYSLQPGYYDDIEWYGRDNDGSRVATEVYIYKATAYPASGGDKVESFGKLVLIN